MDQFHTIKISPRYRNMYRVEDHVNMVWGWTCDQFGVPGPRISGAVRWNWDSHNTYYFRDEADAVLFALRWL